MRLLVSALVAFLVVGCATAGKDFPMERAGEVKTMADARRILGEPVSVGRNANSGQTVWVWSYAKVAPFVPCRSKALKIAFDADGKVVKVGHARNR